MSKEARSYDLLWFSIALLFVVGLFFYMPIKANDYWWYMRVGRDTLQSGSVPSIETISHTRAGDVVINQQWLAGIIFYLVYQVGGVNFTYLLGGVCLAFAYGMIWWMMRESSGPKTATILFYLLAACTSNNWVMRPQLLVYPLFILCLWALYQWQEGYNRYLFILPVSVLLWVNLHGSFVLPFVLAGSALFFGSGERKRLLYAIVAMFVAIFINPYGVGIIKFFFSVLNSQSNLLYSAEWQPPTVSDWQNKIFFACLLLFAPLASYFSNRLHPLEWVWFLGFSWLALSGSRYVIWFMFLLIIFYARLIAEFSKKTIDASVTAASIPLNITVSIVALVASFAYFPAVRGLWQTNAPNPYELESTPIDAVKWLSAHNDLPGPMWNDYAFGSYLAFALPSRPVSIDSRVYPFPPDQWDEYLKINNALGWQEVFDRDNIGLLFLSTERQQPLIDAISESKTWCEQYHDDYAVIFSRCIK